MSQLASPQAQEDRAETSLLPRAKGLLDPFKLPTRLPLLHPRAGTAAVPQETRLHSTAEILANLLFFWARFAISRRFRPAGLAALGRDVGQRFAAFQGYWFELGGLLAQRGGLFSGDFREQLQRHCQPARSMEFDEVEVIVGEDLGFPLHMLFSRFEQTPLRCGPYADTYRATLRREDVDVEVKVRRPLLEERLRRDLGVFRWVAKVLDRLSQGRGQVFRDLIDLYADRIPALLDLRYEASAMRRARKVLRDHGVDVPKLFRGYTGKRVLVTEHVTAPTLQELIDFRARDSLGAQEWLWTNGVDLERVGRRLYHSMLRQIFEDNFFLQNFGPHNIVVLRDNRLAVVSCDATGSLDKRFLTIINLALAAIARNAYEKFADTLLLLCDSLPAGDIGDVRAEIIRAVRTHTARAALEAASHEEKSLFVLTADVSAILYRHAIVVDWQMLKLMLAMGSADPAISACYPEMNHGAELGRYARKAAGRRVRQVFSSGIGHALMGLVSPLTELVRFETASMRKKAQTFRASTGKLAYVGATLVKWLGRAVLAGGLYGVWLYLHQHHYDLLEPFYGTAVSAHALQAEWLPSSWWLLVFFAVFILYRTARDIARHLSEKEIDSDTKSI